MSYLDRSPRFRDKTNQNNKGKLVSRCVTDKNPPPSQTPTAKSDNKNGNDECFYNIPNVFGRRKRTINYGGAPFSSWTNRNTSQCLRTCDPQVPGIRYDPTNRIQDRDDWLKHNIHIPPIENRIPRFFSPTANDLAAATIAAAQAAPEHVTVTKLLDKTNTVDTRHAPPGPGTYSPEAATRKNFAYKARNILMIPPEAEASTLRSPPTRLPAPTKPLVVLNSPRINPSSTNLYTSSNGGDSVALNARCRAYGYTVTTDGKVLERGFFGGPELRGPAYYNTTDVPHAPADEYSAKHGGINWAPKSYFGFLGGRSVFEGKSGPGPTDYDPFHVERQMKVYAEHSYRQKLHTVGKKSNDDFVLSELRQNDPEYLLGQQVGKFSRTLQRTFRTHHHNNMLLEQQQQLDNDGAVTNDGETESPAKSGRDIVTYTESQILPGPGHYKFPRWLDEPVMWWRTTLRNQAVAFGSTKQRKISLLPSADCLITPSVGAYDITHQWQRTPNARLATLGVVFDTTAARFGVQNTFMSDGNGGGGGLNSVDSGTPGVGAYNVMNNNSVQANVFHYITNKVGKLNTGFGTTDARGTIDAAGGDQSNTAAGLFSSAGGGAVPTFKGKYEYGTAPGLYEVQKHGALNVKDARQPNAFAKTKYARLNYYERSNKPHPHEHSNEDCTPAPGAHEVVRAFKRTQVKRSFHQPARRRRGHGRARQYSLAFLSSEPRADIMKTYGIWQGGDACPSSAQYSTNVSSLNRRLAPWDKQRRFLSPNLEDLPGPADYQLPPALDSSVMKSTFNETLREPDEEDTFTKKSRIAKPGRFSADLTNSYNNGACNQPMRKKLSGKRAFRRKNQSDGTSRNNADDVKQQELQLDV